MDCIKVYPFIMYKHFDLICSISCSKSCMIQIHIIDLADIFGLQFNHEMPPTILQLLVDGNVPRTFPLSRDNVGTPNHPPEETLVSLNDLRDGWESPHTNRQLNY